MPYDHDVLAELDEQIDALESPTVEEVYDAVLPYEAGMVAASAVRRVLDGGGSFPPDGWVVNTDGDGQVRLVSTADTPLAIVNGNQSATTLMQSSDVKISFTAVASGLPGEAISVVLQANSDDEDLSVAVDENAITVVLEAVSGSITSTAQDVADLVNGDPDASVLVSAEVVNDGTFTGQVSQQFLALPVAFTVSSAGDVVAGNLTLLVGTTQIVLGGDGPSMLIAGPTSDNDLFRAGMDDGGAWGITKDGLEYFQAFDAGVDDGDVSDSERVQWFDDTSGAPSIRFKERDVDGTLHSGRSAALSDDGDAFLGVTKPVVEAATATAILAALVTLGLVTDDS